LTTAINNQDWSAVGSNLVSGIRTALTNFMSLDTTWAETFASNFATSVRTAFTSIDWAGLNEAFAGLGVAIREAITGLVGGIGSELNISMPDINWDTIIGAFSWGDWITAINWAAWIPSFGWGDYIASIEWSSFVPSISWSSFVPSIQWSSFIPSINWESIIPEFSWGSWIPSLDWSRFIPFLGALGGGGAEAAPAPSGGGGGGGGFSGGGGTRSLVGVNGITVNVANVSSDMDVHSMASTLAREFRRRVR
jgi:hypothetical protein